MFGEDSGGKLALTVSILVGSVLLAQPRSAQTSLDEASAAYQRGETINVAELRAESEADA